MVSIVMPIFNRAEVIITTLNSVLSQSYKNWECIIVDDGSTDATMSIISKISSKEERFKIFQRGHEIPKGAPSCRNIGIAKSCGEFIIFLDSDDTLELHCLESRVKEFEQNLENDFLVFPMGVFQNGEILKKEINNSDSYLNDFLKYKLPWSIMCPIWKSEFIKKIEGFKESYPRLNDPELMIRALLVDDVRFKIINTSYDTVYYPSVTNWTTISKKYFNSLVLFIPNISSELDVKNKSHLKKLLIGYLKVWYRDFYFPDNMNLLNQNVELIRLFRNNGIISFYKSIVLKIVLYNHILLKYILRKIQNYQISKLNENL